MELNQTRIEDAIVREVSDKIIDDGDLYARVKHAADERINAHFAKAGDAQIQAAIEAAIQKGFEHEYSRVDAFGKRQSEPTTIRAELEKMISGYWNATVDKQGKPSSGYGADITRAEWMMMQMVAADFRGDMKQHVANLGGALKDKLRDELHETVNKLLSETFHVNSVGDQAKRRSDRSIDPWAAPL
jgi:hypothetical protein